MLVRLVVVVMCFAWASGELQCNGPGRFSTTPGMCTTEYYTCSRDANKEFVAYVLSCPGKTLFNERTRKCSNARTVYCNHPSTTTSSGQITEATSSRQKGTSVQTSWISRPEYSIELTTKRQKVEYRKPGRLPWVTPRPHFTTPTPMVTGAKPQRNQWRIRLPTTKRTTLAMARKPLVSPQKIMTQRRTNSHKRRTRFTTPKNVKSKVFTMGGINKSSTNLVQVVAVSTPTLPIIQHHHNINVTTSKTLNANPKESSSVPDDTLANIIPNSLQTPTGILLSPTGSTHIMHPISDGLIQINGNKIQIPSNLTHSMLTPIPTTLWSSSFHNNYETTPEIIVKNGQSSIPFMDIFEPGEPSANLEIVDVIFNSNLTKPIDTHLIQHSKPPTKYISYFYNTVSVNNKIKHEKHRQPKTDRVRYEN